MANIYLEKIASFKEQVIGAVSPAWLESHVAGKYGKKTNHNWGQVFEKEVGGFARQSLRSGAEASILGGIGKLHSTGAGALAGAIGGIHGFMASTSNQAKELHKKYR